jgi:DNA-binding CsgD family transcriptional regulator
MLKEPCPICKSNYLGETCPCESGFKPQALNCDCGKTALSVYFDDLGEWPLCADCLALLEDEFAPLPLPIFEGTHPLDDLDDPAPKPFPQSVPNTHILADKTLTDRELEILHLYDRTNREIADRLDIGITTVRSHWKSIKDKLSIHSRWETPYLLGHKGPLKGYPIALGTSTHPQTSPQTDSPALYSVTITVSGHLANLQDLLSLLT